MVRTARRIMTGLSLSAAALAFAPAMTAGAQQTQATVKAKHHSILKGAAVGAVGGHLTHHKHGTMIGAAVGAGIQHHRNKKIN
ncbi:MAG: hypothetical protein M3Z30_05970 [Gemmatimonadota bacterium]|nr:hypothetical protein [Gemmatimonadota bacterium]